MADWLVSWIGGLIVKLNNNYWKEGHTKSHWYNADDCQQLGWRIAQAERTHFQLLQQATRGEIKSPIVFTDLMIPKLMTIIFDAYITTSTAMHTQAKSIWHHQHRHRHHHRHHHHHRWSRAYDDCDKDKVKLKGLEH
uniref:Uncharacterized protein n=1 Tax=Glossina pallidipes TaxID=7398 RepID=A0A1A9Z618_GLOPL